MTGRDNHQDNLGVYDDGHRYCFACGWYIAPDTSNSFDVVGEDLTDYSYQYIPCRGILEEAFRFYDVKTKVDGNGKPLETGFTYPDETVKIRSFDEKKFRWSSTPKAGLFGRNKFAAGSSKFVTITEGEYDALSLWQVLRSPVVSVQSCVTAARDCAVERSWLNSFERVYLAFDNDQPGRDAERDVAKLFDFNKVYSVRFDTRKDANEFLQHSEETELKRLWWNAKKYLPENIISSNDEFKQILLTPLQKGISYPFPTLTDMTYGIRTGETVLLKAQEGVGKTEIMHSIEHHLLKETKDDIAAIFLEEPKRRHLQAIAGIELQRPCHLPDAGVTPDQTFTALQTVLGRDDRLHLYSHFGSDDPEILLDTIRFLVSARAVRYVLFDHISMAVSGLAGEDERRALDYISSRLEMMVKELDFALIMVTHVNDLGQTRGSRYIAKIADICIDATRDLTNPDPQERNRTHLVISKNRFCGRTGPAGKLLFNPATYTLSEDLGLSEPANDNSISESRVA